MKNMKNWPILLLFLFFCGSCTHENDCPRKAKAILEPIDNSGVKGIVFFSEEKQGVKIIGEFSGLTPGEHGLHIHEYGDCENTGGHFNPHNAPHGGPFDSPGHAGDLGNVNANSSGHARFERLDFVITLDGSESVLGKSIMITKFKDDFSSQPSGNSGPGVACGIIVPIK